jgi:hypothetical protein
LVTFDGLHPADSEFFERVYVTDPFDLSGYTHILPQGEGSQFRHPGATAPSTGEQLVISAENRARFQAQLASRLPPRPLAMRYRYGVLW